MNEPVSRYEQELRLWGFLAQGLIAVSVLTVLLVYAFAPSDRADTLAILGLFGLGCGAYILLLRLWANRSTPRRSIRRARPNSGDRRRYLDYAVQTTRD